MLLILLITVLDVSNLFGVVQCMLVLLLVVSIGIDGCVSKPLVCRERHDFCCGQCFFYYQCFFFLIFFCHNNLRLMSDHSHLKNERGNKYDSSDERHYPNRYAALEYHRNMHVINIVLSEYDDVKGKFLYYHDKDDTDPDLHVSHLFLLRAGNHLRLKLNEHNTEEAVEAADEAADDDA
jgi:hypothetical protein